MPSSSSRSITISTGTRTEGPWPKDIDPDEVLTEIARVVKPGGILLLVDHSAKPGTGSADAGTAAPHRRAVRAARFRETRFRARRHERCAAPSRRPARPDHLQRRDGRQDGPLRDGVPQARETGGAVEWTAFCGRTTRPIRRLDGRSLRPRALRPGAGGGVRAGVRGARRRPQAQPLDVVHLPAAPRAGVESHGRALCHRVARRGARLPRPPDPRSSGCAAARSS